MQYSLYMAMQAIQLIQYSLYYYTYSYTKPTLSLQHITLTLCYNIFTARLQYAYTIPIVRLQAYYTCSKVKLRRLLEETNGVHISNYNSASKINNCVLLPMVLQPYLGHNLPYFLFQSKLNPIYSLSPLRLRQEYTTPKYANTKLTLSLY